MPSYEADETPKHPLVNPPALLELSAIDRTCVQRLIGHTLAHRARVHPTNIEMVPRK
jgi:hypothetical protein